MILKNIGIIGGGQLGAMLIEYGIRKINTSIEIRVLEADANCSCAYLAKSDNNITMVRGSIKDPTKVLHFVSDCDVVTWETEHFDATLLTSSKKLCSNIDFLKIVQDKTKQKQFYTRHNINTVPYVVGINGLDFKVTTNNGRIYVKDLHTDEMVVCGDLSIVIKNATGGYDGKGVVVANTKNIDELMHFYDDKNILIEKYLESVVEFSAIFVKQQHTTILYDLVAMSFHSTENILLKCYPAAHILKSKYKEAVEFAKSVHNRIIEAFPDGNSQYTDGIMVIEMFYNSPAKTFYVNEIAPRVHNSGHHTIHSHNISQFEMLARVMLNCAIREPKKEYEYIMRNILGPTGYEGTYHYDIDCGILSTSSTKFVDYHKPITRPFKKMGHVTHIHTNYTVVCNKYEDWLQSIKIMSIPPSDVQKVGVIMGSRSDFTHMSQALEVFKRLEIEYEVIVVSAHRTPDRMVEYAKTARDRGIKVIIAGAGGAAHLPGMIAAFTCVPVIGVPIESKSMNGLDSLYSIVQMPPGVPVGCMSINGSRNAAIYAAQILSVNLGRSYNELCEYKKEMEQEVISHLTFEK